MGSVKSGVARTPRRVSIWPCVCFSLSITCVPSSSYRTCPLHIQPRSKLTDFNDAWCSISMSISFWVALSQKKSPFMALIPRDRYYQPALHLLFRCIYKDLWSAITTNMPATPGGLLRCNRFIILPVVLESEGTSWNQLKAIAGKKRESRFFVSTVRTRAAELSATRPPHFLLVSFCYECRTWDLDRQQSVTSSLTLFCRPGYSRVVMFIWRSFWVWETFPFLTVIWFSES